MGYLGRRIGKSQNQGDSNPGGANGAVGGGILDLLSNGYFQRQGNIYNVPSENTGITATGGIISDYADGSDVYRAHVFTSTGTFDVTSLAVGNLPNAVDYLVVAGGVGGSDRGNGAGGGGAGGLLSSHPDIPEPFRQTAFTAVAGRTYTMTVGAGGRAGQEGIVGQVGRGAPGSTSSITYPGPVTVVTTTGGGAIFIVSQNIPLTGIVTDVTGYASGNVKTYKV